MAQSADFDGNHTGDETTHQKYDLHWNYHDTIILNGICNFLDSGSLTDIILSVENQTIKVHKLVLASCSPYFLQLFKVSYHFLYEIFTSRLLIIKLITFSPKMISIGRKWKAFNILLSFYKMLPTTTLVPLLRTCIKASVS